ncbi:hypothetical protein D3C79_774550 [compost metagenome]
MHAVHRSGRQQRFGTGDEGQGKGGHQQGRISQLQQIFGAQPVDGLGQVCRHLHAIDGQCQPHADQRHARHTEQGPRYEPQPLWPQAFPTPHHGDGPHTEQAGLPATAGTFKGQGASHCSGEPDQVLQARRLRRGVEHHMHL